MRPVLEPPGSTLTAGFLVALLALVVAYDLWALCQYGPDATISYVLRRAGQRWPPFSYVLAFAVGVLFGHLFP